MNFQARLKQAIEKSGLTQTQVAKKINVTHASVSRWVNGGSYTMENAIALAKVLNVEPAWLVFGVDDLSAVQTEPPDWEELRNQIEKLAPAYQQIVGVIVAALVQQYAEKK